MRKHRLSWWRRYRTLVISLSAVVVFITTYLLILPALTLEKGVAGKLGVTVASEDSGVNVSSTGSGGTVAVEASYGAKAGIPKDTALKVKEISEKTTEYKTYFTKAVEALNEEDGTAVSDLSFAHFYEMTLQAGGDEIEPKAPVDVTITYDQGVKAKDAGHVRVIHFKEEKGKVQAEVLDPEDVDVTIKKEKMASASFEADSFSVYAVVYTVDFEYEVDGKKHTYSLDGGDSVSLRELAQVLHLEDGVKNAGLTEAERIEQLIDNIESVDFSDPSLVAVCQAKKDTTAAELITKHKLHVIYPLGLTQDEVLAINHKKYEEGDWVLIGLQAFDTTETLTIKLKTGESIAVKVTDAQDAPMNPDGETVQTIINPAGTTIDLFDYWVVSQDIAGRDAWGDLNQGQGAAEAGDDKPLNGTGNNKGINASEDDEENGHALKFVPAWTGTVYNGNKIGTTGNPWQSVNLDGRDGLNSYTGNGNPFQGIVQNTLSGGYPQLTDNQTIGATGESLSYLFDPEEDHAGKASYTGANQLLYVDSEGYYTYDSRDYLAEFDKDSKEFTLKKQTSNNTEIRGFWPFGTQNFWLGMHVNTQFSMPRNGQVLNPKQEYKDMQFEFSGDDDVWLYVDGVLIGDAGGIHNRTEIDINFAKGTVTVTGQKDPAHPGSFEETLWLDDLYKAAGKYDDSAWEAIPGNSEHKRFKENTYHTFDMFYLERGGGESNLYIHYNLISTVEFSAHKSFKGTERLTRDQFQFEMVGLDGQYKKWDASSGGEPPEGAIKDKSGQYWVLKDASVKAIMPSSGTENGEGTVASPKKTHEDGYTSYITGVTEDGNVNFGDAEISQEERDACNAGDPSSYLYRVREIVPDDAVNDDGVTWADATDEQKAAGGFVKDHVVYDGRVYYWLATVRAEEVMGGDGTTYTTYNLSKSRYLDEDYTQPDTETSFFNFTNTYVPDTGKVEFTKTDKDGNALAGATFGLFTDEACTKEAVNIDAETEAGRVQWTSVSDADGKVSFEGVRTGTYYMKELSAPAGYGLDETVYTVVIEDSKDTSKHSKIYINGDETQTEIRKIANAEDGKLSLVKKWLNPAGTEISGGNHTAAVNLYKKADASAGEPSDVTVVYHRAGAGWDLDTGTGNKYTVEGKTSFDLLWHLGDNASHYLYDMKVNGVLVDAENKEVDLGIAKVKWVPWDEDRQLSILTVSNIREDLNIEYMSNCDWLSTKPFVENAVDFVPSSADPDPVFVQKIDLDQGNDWSSDLTVGGKDSSHEGYDLPATDDNGNKYLYYIVELDADGNEIEVGESPEDGVVLNGYSANNETGISDQGVLYVYNQSGDASLINVDIKKMDNTSGGSYLAGAQFKLEYREDSSGTWTIASAEEIHQLDDDGCFTVPKDGITLTGLKDGEYRLEEVTAPEGYVIDEKYPVIFTVAGGAITSTDGTISGVEYTAASVDANAQFAIPNTSGSKLPFTGGPGTLLYTALGLLLIAAAGWMWLRRRKRT